MLTGGLGPTDDDLTRDVVAAVLERPLHEVAEVRERIEQRYARLGRPMPENNLRQAQVPEGAEWLENRNGTAPGIWIEHKDQFVVLLAGPAARTRASCSMPLVFRASNAWPPASESRRVFTKWWGCRNRKSTN